MRWWNRLIISVFQGIENWIYPAYYLRNLLFHRYDRVKLGLRPYLYSDCVQRMFLANMKLIVEFMEKEHPEKYVCWYGEDPVSGPRYGDKVTYPVVYVPEYDGRYVMDIIKEIYNWYTKEYPKLVHLSDLMLTVWDLLRTNKIKSPREYVDHCRDVHDLELICQNLGGENLFNAAKALSIHDRLEAQIHNEQQKYLHLCIEVRPHLWI